MSDLGKRLDDLARNATAGTTMIDPSRRATAERPFRRGGLVIALATLVAVIAMLVVWQGGDTSSTSVAAGEGDEQGEEAGQDGGAAAGALSGPCDLESIVPVLRAGLPTYDYEPAGSFGALYDDAQAVVRGDVVSAARVEVNGGSFVELTLAGVADLVTGQARPDVDVIAYNALWADRSKPDPLRSPIVFDDLTFVGFLSPWSGVRGGWAPGPEGLYVGCGADGRFAAVIENAAGPTDPAEPTVAELEEAIPAYAAHLRDEVAEREAAQDDVEAAEQAAEQAAEEARAAAEEAAGREAERIEALGFDRPETLADARALWDAAGVEDYQLSYSEFRPQGGSTPVRVSVERGQIVDVQYQEAFGATEQAWTVDDLFNLAEAAATVQEVEFDRTYGYPTLLRIDPDSTIRDELTFRGVEMVTAATLDLADARIDAWLATGPAPMPPSSAVAAMLRNTNEGEVLEVHLLHDEPEFDAFVYRTSDSICAVVAFKTIGDQNPQYSDEFGGGCRPTVGFERGPLVSMDRRPSGASYILVIPALDEFGTEWTASAEVGRLDITPRSALLIVDDEDIPDPGPFPITFEVAGETHTLPWN